MCGSADTVVSRRARTWSVSSARRLEGLTTISDRRYKCAKRLTWRHHTPATDLR